MQRQKNALPPLFRQLPQKRQNFNPARNIKESRRFIQQHNRRILGQRPGNHHLLPFPVGKLCNIPARKTFNPDSFHSLGNNSTVFPAQPAQKSSIRITPHAHHILNTQRADLKPVGIDNADIPCKIHARHAGNIPTINIHQTFQRRKLTPQHFQQSRFTHTVGTYKRHKLAPLQRSVNVSQQHTAAISRGQPLNLQHWPITSSCSQSHKLSPAHLLSA